MKKGDKVRFLSEVGGGKVAGFQGKNIVLVEDEDGFEIPMPINEVVVVEQDDYAMGKMISAKMEAQQKADTDDERYAPAFGEHCAHPLAHGAHAHLRAQRKEHDAHNDHSRALQEAELDAGGDGSNGDAEHQHDGYDGLHRLKRFQ